MDFKVGDKVKFKPSLPVGHGLQRHGQVGTLTAVGDLPAQGWKVDIEFADGGIERGISVHQIERA
jgi:hypothetical protein